MSISLPSERSEVTPKALSPPRHKDTKILNDDAEGGTQSSPGQRLGKQLYRLLDMYASNSNSHYNWLLSLVFMARSKFSGST